MADAIEQTDVDVFSITYESQSVSFCFPSGSKEWIPQVIRSTGTFYESECLEFIGKNILKPGSFLDVGANIGNHTLFFSRILGRKVMSFEAIAGNYRYLTENIRLNKVEEQVRPFNFGLGASNARADFEKPNTGDSGSYRKARDNPLGAVEIRALDDCVFGDDWPTEERVAFIKIDVEGMEYDVLRGAADTLHKHKPGLSIEIKSTKEYARIYDFLEPIGYCVVGAFNATPTFIFDVLEAPDDRERLEKLVRQFAAYYIKARGRA